VRHWERKSIAVSPGELPASALLIAGSRLRHEPERDSADSERYERQDEANKHHRRMASLLLDDGIIDDDGGCKADLTFAWPEYRDIALQYAGATR
jgi:hypothetical protein